MEKIKIFELDSASESPNELKLFDRNIYLDNLGILKNQIEEFTKLPIGWDGYGAIPLIAEISDKAKCFISMLDDLFIDQISDIYPNPHGTLTVEWLNKSNNKLSLEIGVNNYSYFIDNEPPTLVTEDGAPDLAQFSSCLGEFYQDEIPRIRF